MKVYKCFVLGLMIILSSANIYAQEVQITFDSDGKYATITKDINQKSGLFSQYVAFVEASIYQINDEYILDIIFLKDNKQVRERRRLDKDQFLAIRKEFENSAFFKTGSIVEKRIVSKRKSFLTATTSWGVITGFMIPSRYNFSTQQGVGYFMLSTGSSFYVPFLYTKDKFITPGQAKFTEYAVTRSFFHAYTVSSLIDGDNLDSYALSYSLLSLGQMVGYYHYGKNISASEANNFTYFSDIGLISGTLLGAALDNEFKDVGPAISLASIIGGGVYGHFSKGKRNTTFGDLLVDYSGTFIGSYSAATVANILTNYNEEAILGATSAGALLGMWGIRKLSENYDFKDYHGVYIASSTFAGLLTGFGASYTFFGDLNESTLKPYGIIGALGSAAGFYIMYDYFKDDAIAPKSDASLSSNWDVNFNPLVLMMPTDSNIPMNAFSIKYTFN